MGHLLNLNKPIPAARQSIPFSWDAKGNVPSSPCAVRLCMARVEVWRYVLPQWQVYGLVCVCTTWCLYRLLYSVKRLPHPRMLHTYGFSPSKSHTQYKTNLERESCIHLNIYGFEKYLFKVKCLPLSTNIQIYFETLHLFIKLRKLNTIFAIKKIQFMHP